MSTQVFSVIWLGFVCLCTRVEGEREEDLEFFLTVMTLTRVRAGWRKIKVVTLFFFFSKRVIYISFFKTISVHFVSTRKKNFPKLLLSLSWSYSNFKMEMTSRRSSFPSFINEETTAANVPPKLHNHSVNIQNWIYYSHPLGQCPHRFFFSKKIHGKELTVWQMFRVFSCTTKK